MLGRLSKSLSTAQLQSLNTLLPSWSVHQESLSKTYRFNSNKDAWDFLELAQKLSRSHRFKPVCMYNENHVEVRLEGADNITRAHVSAAGFLDKAAKSVKEETYEH